MDEPWLSRGAPAADRDAPRWWREGDDEVDTLALSLGPFGGGG